MYLFVSGFAFPQLLKKERICENKTAQSYIHHTEPRGTKKVTIHLYKSDQNKVRTGLWIVSSFQVLIPVSEKTIAQTEL